MNTKIIDILDPQAGKIEETVVDNAGKKEEVLAEVAEKAAKLAEVVENPSNAAQKRVMDSLGLGKYQSLREIATTMQFPTLMRVGLRQILFDSYNAFETTWQEWAQSIPSDKMAEDWVEMNRLGTLPGVGEGDPYPTIDASLDRAVRIANQKYGGNHAVLSSN